MSVISVARDERVRPQAGESAPRATNGSDSDGDGKRYDIASVWTQKAEDWLTRVLPVNGRVVLNWDLLSPIAGFASSILFAVLALMQYGVVA